MKNEKLIEGIKNVLESMNDTNLVRINNAYAYEKGGREIHKNDEDFFQTHYGKDLTGLIRAVTNGRYSEAHDWLIVDNYGDLLSFDNTWGYLHDTDVLAEFVSENFNEFSDLFDFDENSFDEEE